MEESTTDFPFEITTAVCDPEMDELLLTSNLQVVVVIFGVFLVIAVITVFANCIIIAAIVRAYIFGISARAQASRKAVGRPSQAKQRIRLGNDSSNIPIVLMLSMAVTDTLLGAVIMPLYTIEILYNGQWPLGNLSCKFRMYLDIVLSVSSIYHVTCMAGDRYLAICRPFLHQRLSVRTGVVFVVLCWAAPIAITLLFHVPEEASTRVIRLTHPECPSVNRVGGQRNNDNITSESVDSLDRAVVPSSPGILICVQVFSPILHAITLTMNFYIPFIAIIVFYTFILLEIKKVSKRKSILKGRKKVECVKGVCRETGHKDLESKTDVSKTEQSNGIAPSMRETELVVNSVRVLTSQEVIVSNAKRALDSETIMIENACADHLKTANSSSLDRDSEECKDSNPKTVLEEKKSSEDIENPELARTKSRKATSKSLKAVKTVSIVVVCFLVCWLPFSVYILVLTLTGEAGSHQLMWFILWLGYLNSSLNPIFYCGHVTVRAALKDLLYGKSTKS